MEREIFQFGDPQIEPLDFFDGDEVNLTQEVDDFGLVAIHATYYCQTRFRHSWGWILKSLRR